MAILSPNKAELCKILIITLVFEKKANFFAENWQKSPKIVIVTSTPGRYTEID
jgi:pyridoxal/pyridoxine/pyridoxamine kinase